MSIKGLTCKELVELVTAYLEEALSAQDHARFEEHLAMCEACSIYVVQMRQTIELVGNVRAKAIPEEAQNEVLDLFRHWKRG